MESTPRNSAPRLCRSATSRRQPDAHGFIHCSYCGYPVAYSVNWAQQKPCLSCGYKFPDLLYPPISASVPTRPAIQPCSAVLGGILTITAPPPGKRPLASAGRCPKCKGPQAHNAICKDCWMKSARRKSTRVATMRAAAMPTLLWSGTAYGVAGVFARVYTLSATDLSGFKWSAAVLIAAIVFAYLLQPSREP